MTNARYRELLEAAPPLTKKDFAGLKSFTLKVNPMVAAVLMALYR